MLCGKNCVASEIGIGFVYAASILIWTSTPGVPNKSREKAAPTHQHHVSGCTGTARVIEFSQASSL